MKSFLGLSHRYRLDIFIPTWILKPHRIAIFAAVLSCLSLSANSAKAQLANSVSCQANSFHSAGTDSCTVKLNWTVKRKTAVFLYSSAPALTLPATVYVNTGASSVSFRANLASVKSAETVYITAEASTSMETKATYGIRLNPATLQTRKLTINATSISFGSVALNTDAVQTVTLTSIGTAAVSVNSAAVTGTGFSISGSSSPVTLNPGQSLTLNLQFAATVAGSATGQLTVSSNSSSNPTATLALSGIGTSTSHDVVLSWEPPTPSTVTIVGYDVYRAPSGTTSFQILTSSPVGSTSYTDSGVTPGRTYVYEVTSVDSAGVESVPSNTSIAAIP